MLNRLKRALYTTLDWWEDSKGAKYFRLGEVYQSPNDGYTIVTNHGFKIRIHCRELVYDCVYLNRWTRNKKISIYHVYCVCADDVPEQLKEKLKGDLMISSFLHPWASKESQKKQVIKAYIDLLLGE
jgi:hypothetical protein